MNIIPGYTGIHADLLKISKKGNEREPELLWILRREVKKDMICIDLGANIGYITLLMADIVGPRGRVYAIEPDPINIEVLKSTIKLNKYEDIVNVSQFGISNKKGTAKFYIGKSSNLGGMFETNNTTGDSITVDVDTLTNFCSKNKIFPEIIKLDIEGFEVEMLDGFYNYVKDHNFPCKIVTELHPIYYSDKRSLKYWFEKFLQCGFKTKYVVSAAVPIPDKFKEWGYKPIKICGNRGVYTNFSEEHMLEACCFINKQQIPTKKKISQKIARFVMIER